MNTLHFNYSKLKGKIVEKYGSQQRFAKELGISNQSLTNKMYCKHYFNSFEIMRSVELLDIPLTEISDYFFTKN